jgi:hypothetical protein
MSDCEIVIATRRLTSSRDDPQGQVILAYQTQAEIDPDPWNAARFADGKSVNNVLGSQHFPAPSICCASHEMWIAAVDVLVRMTPSGN